MDKKFKIAILGSTSHVASGLINNFLENGEVELHLYARAPEKVRAFLGAIGKSESKECVIYGDYADFPKHDYDVVINCVGVGASNKLQDNYSNYFTITEEYDNLVLKYLRDNHPDTLYISFSSGAIYGGRFLSPADENTSHNIRVNHVTKEDYYAIARLNAEAKHRSFGNLKIIDFRIFSYFSRFIDLADNYFIAEVLNSILNKTTLVTDGTDIIRDYLHPKDLFSMVKLCMNGGNINAAFDVMSAAPIKKSEILDYFSREYGLKYETGELSGRTAPTGSKLNYYSKYNKAAEVGYKPAFGSMDTIREESKFVLEKLK